MILTGDVNSIVVGEKSNIQERCVVHVSSAKNGTQGNGTIIGNHVTVESGAILHACTLEDESYIGIGAIVLDGAVVEKRAMIAPGSVVTPGTRIPSGQMWAGTPAKFLRNLSQEEQNSIIDMSRDQSLLADEHRVACDKQLEDLLREVESTELKEDRLEEYQYIPGSNREGR